MDVIHWEDQQKFNELAELKNLLTSKEARAKELQSYLAAKYPDLKEFQTPVGRLVRGVRSNYSPIDNSLAIKVIGQRDFNQIAKVSKTDVEKLGGKKYVQKLLELKAFKQLPSTTYYSLKADVSVG